MKFYYALLLFFLTILQNINITNAFIMSTKDGILGFGDLVKRIRNEGDNENTSDTNFPNVDAFINEENIQLSPEIRGMLYYYYYYYASSKIK